MLDFTEPERIRTSPDEIVPATINAEKLLEKETDVIRNYEIPTLFPRGMVMMVASKLVDQWFHPDGYGLGEYHGWFICDGRNGTPDLKSRFVVGRDHRSEDNEQVGNVGGFARVKLRENEMPLHTHKDSGHVHRFKFTTQSSEGGHSHTYKDIYYSDSFFQRDVYDFAPTPTGIGSNAKWDRDNVGLQFDRETLNSGRHSHNIDGDSETSRANLQNTGGNEEHENRPPFYTVVYIIYLFH